MFTYWFLLDVLAMVTTFGVGIALNMIFKRWWVSVVLFGLFSIYLFVQSDVALSWPEWLLYAVSVCGVLLSAWGIVTLRKMGYALFTK